MTPLEHPPNLIRDPYDLSIFFRQTDEYQHGFEICRDSIFPVCTPTLAANLGEPSDLSGLMFIHHSSSMGDWQQWLEFAAQGLKINASGPAFPLYSLALQETENGAGIMIGHEPLVRDSMRDGKLVAPFPQKKRLAISLVVETAGPVAEDTLVGRIIEQLRAG